MFYSDGLDPLIAHSFFGGLLIDNCLSLRLRCYHGAASAEGSLCKGCNGRYSDNRVCNRLNETLDNTVACYAIQYAGSASLPVFV